MANPILYPLNYALGNNKALGFPRVQYAKITEMIDSINKITAGTITLTDVELGDGTVALPSLTFASDLDSGLYRIGANNIGLTLGGVKSVDFGVNLTGFTGAITASTTITATTSVLAPLFDTATAVAMVIGTTATSLAITPATTITGLSTLSGGINIAKGTVTQATAITTGVTVNASAGVITTVSSTLAAGSNAAFIVTNSFASATSSIQLTVDDSATAGLAKLNVEILGAGVFSINITNIHATNAFNNILNIHFLIV